MIVSIIGKFVDGAMVSDGIDEVSGDDRDEVLRIVGEYGAEMRPLHPGTADPTLSRYFIVDVHRDATAEALAERLRTVPAVDGAYVKAAGEAPSDMR